MDDNKFKGLFKVDISPAQLSVYKKMVEEYPKELQDMLDFYLENGRYPSFSYNGWSFEDIEKHTHYDVYRVYREMYKLMTDDEYLRLFGYMSFGVK